MDGIKGFKYCSTLWRTIHDELLHKVEEYCSKIEEYCSKIKEYCSKVEEYCSKIKEYYFLSKSKL